MALAQCFSALLLFSSLNLTYFALPDFSYTYLGAHMHNLTCDSIDAQHWQLAINAADYRTGLEIDQVPTTTIACMVEFDYFGYHGHVLSNATLTEATVRLETNATDACLTVESTLHECAVHAEVMSLFASPPSLFIDALLSSARLHINERLESYICDVALPALQDDLTNHTAEAVTPLPELEPGAITLSASPLFRAAEKLTAALPLVYGLNVSAAVVGPATLELSVEFPTGKRIHYAGDVNPLNETGAAVVASPEMWTLYLRAFLNQEESVLNRNLLIPYFPGYVDNSTVAVWIPSGTRVVVQFDFAHLWCEEPDTYRCFVRRDGGIRVSNLRLENIGDVGTLFMRHSRDAAMASLNARLLQWTNSSSASDVGGEWFEIPMRPRATVAPLPPLAVAAAFVVVATTTSGLLMTCSVRRHRRQPVVTAKGDPLSTRRLVVEDFILCAGVFACIGCFMWSNMTTAASVVVGTELEVYSFSLMSTARDLWEAGLKPLSVCVFLFSGVYPYFKLVSMLVFTLVLQRPDATVLHVIDYLGKLSLLDTFVMVIMVSGLTVPGIADVHIFAPFYVFLAATVASIALGNYTTCVWRRGTSAKFDILGIIRREARRSVAAVAISHSHAEPVAGGENRVDDMGADDAATEHQPLLAAATTDGSETDDPIALAPWRTATRTAEWRWAWAPALGSATFVLLCSLPAWWWPCLRYRLGGLAPLVTDASKSFGLSELAWATSPTCFIVTLLTVIVAPCVYTFCAPNCQFLASWCAADAFIIACVAGLLQLNQFVQFVLGPGMEEFYTAHAVLLWTLGPLSLAATFVWLLALLSLYRGSL